MCQKSTTQVQVVWQPFTDPESAISKLVIAVAAFFKAATDLKEKLDLYFTCILYMYTNVTSHDNKDETEAMFEYICKHTHTTL